MESGQIEHEAAHLQHWVGNQRKSERHPVTLPDGAAFF
jgi:hypothetical protein